MFKKGKRRSNPPIQRSGSQGFPEGLNTLAHPSTLKDTELSELINGIYSQYGTISKRQGSAVVGQEATDATHIMQLVASYNVAGASRFIRISDNGKPEVLNFSTGLWEYLTATEPDGYAGSNPLFDSGTPIFDTTTITWIVQIGNKLFFSNAVNETIWLEEDGWHIYAELDDPTALPTVAKTGSGTGGYKHYYWYVWYNEAGGTRPSPNADPSSDVEGQGWYGDMPEVLDESTYLTLTLPAAPAGTTKVGIFKSNIFGEGFFIGSVEPDETTFIDKGQLPMDFFGVLPEENTTAGQHFYLLDSYEGRLVGVSVEYGRDTLVWGGGFEKYISFGLPDGAGYFAYRKGDGTTINAIKTHVASNESSLFVFKDNVFGKFQFVYSSITESLEGRVQDVNISVGSISPLSPHVAGNNLRFWSRDGAATIGNEANYGTILRYSVLSLRADAIVSRVTPANIDKVCGIFYQSLSLFGISTDVAGGGNNAILAYDERYNAWSLWTGLFPQCFAKYINPETKEEKLYYGSSSTADVLQMFEGKTDYRTSGGSGTRVTLSLSTKQYDMKLPDQFKRFDRATLVFGTLTGNNTTVGVIRADHRGVRSDPRLRIAQESILSGFGSDEWGNQEFGMMSEEDAGSSVNIRYINLRQKDLFWVKINIQNDGIDDEIDLIGIYLYFSKSNRPLTFSMKLRQLASQQ